MKGCKPIPKIEKQKIQLCISYWYLFSFTMDTNQLKTDPTNRRDTKPQSCNTLLKRLVNNKDITLQRIRPCISVGESLRGYLA
jgi:hypothetical protein